MPLNSRGESRFVLIVCTVILSLAIGSGCSGGGTTEDDGDTGTADVESDAGDTSGTTDSSSDTVGDSGPDTGSDVDGDTTACSPECVHGTCESGACVCDDGYSGQSCDTWDGEDFEGSREGDEAALEALYASLNNPSLTGWGESMSLDDEIEGVTVEEIDGEKRVTVINLRDKGLTGHIDVPEIGNLTELVTFAVYLNSLESPIPQELMNLANHSMKHCYLSMSDADDEVRTSYPHEATTTGSGNIHPGKTKGNEENVFTGTLPAPPDPPDAVLEWLYVSWTDSAELAEDGIDTIEPGIFDIPTLVGVQIYENTNVGASGNYMEFPDLTDMPNLRIFDVGGGTGTPWEEERHGYFTGNVGDKLDGLDQLLSLALSRNGQLTLDFDESDLSDLQTLDSFGAASVNVVGTNLPAYFFDGTLPGVESFSISWPTGEGLTGNLPEFTDHVTLKVFTCTGHSFTGEIPASFWNNYDQMINTNFGWNEFTSIGTDDLTNLGSQYWKIRNLRWYHNEISGRLPTLAWEQPNDNLEDLSRVFIQDNRYLFGDFLWVPSQQNPDGKPVFELYADHFDEANAFDDFDYSPQKEFGDASHEDGGVIDFTGLLTHADNVYQWQKSTDGGSSWSDLSGETTRTLDMSAHGSGDYRLEVTNTTFDSIVANSSLSDGLTLYSVVYSN